MVVINRQRQGKTCAPVFLQVVITNTFDRGTSAGVIGRTNRRPYVVGKVISYM